MTGPDYIAPATLAEAVVAKGEAGVTARVIAGGTDLVLRMRDRVLAPDLLIDLRRLSLDRISIIGGECRMGALTPLSDVLAHPELQAHFPALPAACQEFAGPPIRNLATLGGNIVNASPAADTVPPMMAYDAEVVLARADGERVLPLAEFFTGPGACVLQSDELMTEIRMKLPEGPTASIFVKLGQRRSMAISVVNLAVRVTLDEHGDVAFARIVLGSVSPMPLRASVTESLLVGQALTETIIEAAARQAREEATPISDVRGSDGYRDRMVEVLVRRALTSIRDELAP